ncbi:unnamed protein product [Heterobilharzia americana]|nr:unnamed protein product [Heterobilharzia americana]
MWDPVVVNVSHLSCQTSRVASDRRSLIYSQPPNVLVGRKRARLDDLTEEEKIIRRKILNREAAQKARDRKRNLMEHMEENLAQLRWENEYLKSSNKMLQQKFVEQEQKFQILQKKFEGVIKRVERFAEKGSGSLSARTTVSPHLSKMDPVETPLYNDAPEDVSSTLFDAQVVEVTTHDPSETPKSRNYDSADNLTPSSPLYENILSSLQEDGVPSIPGLTDSYDSEESLSDLLELLSGDAFEDDVLTGGF